MLKKALFAFIVSIPLHIQGDSYTTLLEKGKLPLLSPAMKERKTAKIRLNNGLEAYLISDPLAELSGALMSVKAGSWEDPKEHPGLAHFLEHMLFMGTEKYPDESEYSRFIIEHGGQSNAFTASNTTNYLFTVQSKAFPEAFKRFSNFFEEPLLNPSGVDRELKAIDQEYAKNLENDDIRQLYVIKELVQPDHPFHNFNMGNSQTLSKASREILIDWYKNHYSPHLMRLVAVSSLPIEQLKELVTKELSEVPGKDRQAFSYNKPAFSHELEGKYIYIEPIKDKRVLSILWELPPKFAHMIDSKPQDVVSFVLGHEGEQSLLAQLKREQLAESLSCDGFKLGNNLMVFYVQVELTNEGLRDVDEVLARTFQAIKQFQQTGVPRYLFDEIQTMNRIEYQYQSKQNEFLSLMDHGYNIQDEELTSYPEKTKVLQEYDPGAVQEFLSALTPENGRFLIMAPSKQTLIKPERKEKWLGVEYSVKPVSKDLISKLKHVDVNPDIELPLQNPYIPQNLTLLHQAVPSQIKRVPIPKLLISDAVSTFYYAPDTQYGIPKISWTMQIKTPQVSLEDPVKVVMADLYVKCIEDALSRYSYPAKMAGLNYSIKREDNGIQIALEGYSENALSFFKELLSQTTAFEPTQEKFRLYKDSLLRKYTNFAKASPLEQSMEMFRSLLYHEYVTEQEKAAAIRKVTFPKFAEWHAQLYNKTFLEGIFYGNLQEAEAREAIGLARSAFYHGIYPKNEQLKNKVIVLPNEDGPYFVESHIKSQGNAVLLAVEDSRFSFKDRASQQILMQAIQEPFFTTLRTKQQTGYLVHSLAEEVERKLFNIFAVQSNTHDARDLLSRFETFIEGYLQEMGKETLTKEQFEHIRTSLITKLQEPAKNIKEMGELINLLAFKYDGDFNWMNQRIDALKTLEYPEFLEIAHDFMGRQNKRRLAILLRGEIPQEHNFSYTRARTWNVIRKISDYKARNGEGLVTDKKTP